MEKRGKVAGATCRDHLQATTAVAVAYTAFDLIPAAHHTTK